MQHKSKFLITGRFIKRILSSYVVFLLMVFSFSMVFASTPEITIYTPSTDYTNQTYVNVTVNVSEDNNVSSFIDWNQSLIGYWDFEPSHIKIGGVTDNSSYSNSGDYIGRTLNNITSGKYGNAMYFNGSSEQYLDCNNNNNSLNITNEITIEAWIKEFTTSFNVTFGHSTETKDYAYGIQQTSDGGYIITGEADYNPDVSTSGNVSLIKLDSTGNVVKNATYDKFGYEDFARSVVQSDDGGFIVVGETKNDTGHRDLWCIKTDSNLIKDEDFSFTKGGSESESGYSILKTSDGNYVIAGYEESFDKYPTTQDIWLLKIDDTGSIIKNVTHQASGNARPWFINETENGEFIIAGSNDTGSKEIMFFKTDSNFNNIISGGTYGWGNIGRGDCVKQTNDGKYILTGYTNATYLVGNIYAQSEIVLIKIDTDGNEEWKKTYGSGNRNVGHSVQQTNDGGFIIAGVTNYSTAGENNDYWIIKTDENGDEEWNRTFGGDNNEDAWSILQTTDGGYSIIGDRDISSTNKDIWIIKTDANGNITKSNNNQSLNKTIVGKGRDAYQLELFNGTITGYINNISISTNLSLSDLTQYWHHIVLTYDTTSGIKLYLNGTLVSSDNTITDPINTNLDHLIIGKNYSGKIDEVRIWNRSLSHEEINASYNCSSSYYKNITNLAEGTYPYYAHVIDVDGNENSTENRTITVDTTSPVFSNQNPIEGNHTTDSQQDITVNISDALSGVNSSSINVSLSCSNGSFYLNNASIENAAISYSNNILTVNPSNGGFSFNEDAVIVTIDVTDNATNHNSTTWSFYPFSNVYVYGDGPEDWYDASHVRTIQEGIDNSSAGANVYVWNGTYNESTIQLNKSVNLIGNSSTSTIILNESLTCGNGIDVTTGNVSIQNFSIKYMDIGIRIHNADNNTITNNNIVNNDDHGLYFLSFSNNNTITNNNIANNTNNGIKISSSSNNQIIDNTITNNSQGIDIRGLTAADSNLNNISNNIINNNTNFGIYLYVNTNESIIKNNIIINNGNGIEIRACFRNIISNNNLNNTINSFDTETNYWNNTLNHKKNIIGGPKIGGNYWSNYTGYDENHDGIGETPYNIPGGSNQDFYPLIISPNVTSHSPTGTSVSVSTNIVLTFNKSMSQTTVQNNFSIDPSVSGSNSWTDNYKTLTFNPNSNLNYNTPYTVTICRNATDISDNVMLDNCTWSFTTTTQPNSGSTQPVVDDEEIETENETSSANISDDNTDDGNTGDEDADNTDLDIVDEISEIINSGNMTGNTTTKINFINTDNIIISHISIKPKRNLINTTVKIVDKGNKSENLSEYVKIREIPGKIVYKYIEFNLTENSIDVSDDDLEEIIFEFKVPFTWINGSLKINESSILLMRYHNDTWNTLNTTKINKSETYIFFNASTPGFSTFAVVGSKVVESEKLSTTSEDPEIPWILIIGFIISVTIILIIVLFKARYIYFEKKETDENIKK